MLAEDSKAAARWSLESRGGAFSPCVRAPYFNLGLHPLSHAAVALEAIFEFWLQLAETPKPM
jgi:hypothetical protein